ncbi:MAG: hypothetical protein U5N85_06495 [Arcicella sp.]|nr:hypothetical protein [Arcicella sp.]
MIPLLKKYHQTLFRIYFKTASYLFLLQKGGIGLCPMAVKQNQLEAVTQASACPQPNDGDFNHF